LGNNRQMNRAAGDATPFSVANEDALLADALLGGGLPPEAEWHLW